MIPSDPIVQKAQEQAHAGGQKRQGRFEIYDSPLSEAALRTTAPRSDDSIGALR